MRPTQDPALTTVALGDAEVFANLLAGKAAADQLLRDFAFEGNFRFRTETLSVLKNLEQRSKLGRLCTVVRTLVFAEPLKLHSQRLEMSYGTLGALERQSNEDTRHGHSLAAHIALLRTWNSYAAELKGQGAAKLNPVIGRKIALLEKAREYFLDHVYGDVRQHTQSLFRAWCLECAADQKPVPETLWNRFSARIKGEPTEFYSMLQNLKVLKPELAWQKPGELWNCPDVRRLCEANLAEAPLMKRAPAAVLVEQICIVGGYALSPTGKPCAHEDFSKRLHALHVGNNVGVFGSEGMRFFLEYLVKQSSADRLAVNRLYALLDSCTLTTSADPRPKLRALVAERHFLVTDIARACEIEGRERKDIPRRVLQCENHRRLPLALIAYLVADDADHAKELITQAVAYETSRRQALMRSKPDLAMRQAEHIVLIGQSPKDEKKLRSREDLERDALQTACVALRRLCQLFESVPGSMLLVARRIRSAQERSASAAEDPAYIVAAKRVALERGLAVPTIEDYEALLKKAQLPLTQSRAAAWQDVLVRSLASRSLPDKVAATLSARFEGEASPSWQGIALERRVATRDARYLEHHKHEVGIVLGVRRHGADPDLEVSAPTPVRLQSLSAEIPERSNATRKAVVSAFVESANHGLRGVLQLLHANLKMLARDESDRKQIRETAAYLAAAEGAQPKQMQMARVPYANELVLLMQRRDALFLAGAANKHPDQFVANLQLLFPGTTRSEITKAVIQAVTNDPASFR